MKQILLLLMLTVPVSGCFGDNESPIQIDPTPVICETLNPLVDAHQDALLLDGGPQSLQSGVRLIAGYDGGCG